MKKNGTVLSISLNLTNGMTGMAESKHAPVETLQHMLRAGTLSDKIHLPNFEPNHQDHVHVKVSNLNRQKQNHFGKIIMEQDQESDRRLVRFVSSLSAKAGSGSKIVSEWCYKSKITQDP